MSQGAPAKSKAASPVKTSPKPEKQEKKGKQAATWDEKYDQSRTVPADPRDPRTSGPPCHGNHRPAPAYRGSVSGSNGHASWVGCERCLLRLSYTPAYGATGVHRSAGPIPEDTKKQVEELKEAAPFNPLLKTQAIALEGAERSLLNKLDKIRAKKSAAGYPPRSPDSNETYTPSAAASNETTCPRTPSVIEIPDQEEVQVIDPEHLSQVPGSKSRRSDRPAEEVEYEDRESRTWSTVSSPERRSQ